MAELDTLERVVRARPTERELFCPRCGGDVELDGGEGCARTGARLPVCWCRSCPFTTTTLAELAAAETTRG